VVDDLVEIVVLPLDDADHKQPGVVLKLCEGLRVGGTAPLRLDELILEGLLGGARRLVGRSDIREALEAVLLEADDRVGGHVAGCRWHEKRVRAPFASMRAGRCRFPIAAA
jgi:hypothetical protein